jgi:hypothetical protein
MINFANFKISMSMRFFSFVLLVLFLSACGSGSKTSEQDIIDLLGQTDEDEPIVSNEVIGEIIQQIPSPLEISVLLKESGTKYEVALLNSPDNVSKYNSNFKKALNLGIYGTDLGYTNIYEQNNDGLKYMTVIKELADGLSIGQFFDIETIGRLATNSRNLDSLLLITTKNFNSINHYLQQQNRANLSVLLLTGGWLEALHISAQVSSKAKGNTELREVIGEQKIILENIMLLLSFYSEKDPNIDKLVEDMTPLKQAFDGIEITRTYKESTFEIVDGVMVIKDNSTSTIKITEADVEKIKDITKDIRNKVIN